MRALWLVPVVALVLFGVVLSDAKEVRLVAKKQAFYLHTDGPCDGTGMTDFFMDRNDTGGDVDGCGSVGPAGAMGGFTQAYPGRGPTGILITNESKGEAHIFIQVQAPEQISIEVQFTAGGTACVGQAGPQLVQPTPFGVGAFTEFTTTCTFSGETNDTATPSLVLNVQANANYFVGYEEDHASRIDVTGQKYVAVTTNATNQTSPPAEDEGGLPGPGSVVLLLGVLAVAAVVAVRRRP